MERLTDNGMEPDELLTRLIDVPGIGPRFLAECRQRLGEFLALVNLIAGINDPRVRAAAFDLLHHEGMARARAYLERIAA